MTQGVVKNIIPAIASTNAIIAASCCNEALKLITAMNPFLGYPETNNYMMYSGDEGIYTYTFEHLRKPDCPVCGTLAKNIEVDASMTLGDLIESFTTRPEA
jgi:ubiquitin-activating enzyme E1 C